MFRINKNRLEFALHVLVWVSLITFELSQVLTIGPFRKNDNSIYPPLVWSIIFSILLFYSNILYLIPRFFAQQRYKLFFFLVALSYIIVVLLNTTLDHFYAISLFSSEKEPLRAELSLNAISKMFILSVALAYGLGKNWMISNRRQQQLESEKLTTELKYLKAQINPHFLFNTLNMAYASAVKSNDDTTADIIEKISGFMRYVLYESNEDYVLLSKELQYIDNFIDLQLQRLSPEIASEVKYKVVGNPQNLQIAPMILIPFIENVFKHGVMLSKKAEMLIMIEVREKSLVLMTRNLKVTSIKVVDKTDSGIGIKNASVRLQLLYPGQHVLSITDDEEYFEAHLEINLINILS